MMKLIKLNTGEEIQGEVLEESESTVTVKVEVGKLVLDRSRISSIRSVLDCTALDVGQYVQTPRGTYLKIDGGTFRLVKGPYTAQIDLPSIQDGFPVTHEDVFPPEEEIFPE